VAQLHVLRVFTDEGGRHGNPLGVFLDGDEVREEERQDVAADLGFSETVFVDDAASGRCRIFTPGMELGFAGHPTVGTAWLLAREGRPLASLRPPAGEIPVRYQGELAYVSAAAEWSPPWELEQLHDPAEVEAVDEPPPGRMLPFYWAWLDEAEGVVRARCFSVEDIGEDEATGSAAIVLAAELGRPLTIHQGRGSVLFAESLGPGWAEVGGRVKLEEVRDYPLD
jgi:predicted PhzF superfamily epimerase YddE/YHI9